MARTKTTKPAKKAAAARRAAAKQIARKTAPQGVSVGPERNAAGKLILKNLKRKYNGLSKADPNMMFSCEGLYVTRKPSGQYVVVADWGRSEIPADEFYCRKGTKLRFIANPKQHEYNLEHHVEIMREVQKTAKERNRKTHRYECSWCPQRGRVDHVRRHMHGDNTRPFVCDNRPRDATGAEYPRKLGPNSNPSNEEVAEVFFEQEFEPEQEEIDAEDADDVQSGSDSGVEDSAEEEELDGDEEVVWYKF